VTQEPAAALTGQALNPLFAAVVEATEEAVLNSLLAAPTVTGRDGNTSYGLPVEPVRELLQTAGRLSARAGDQDGHG
jgi:D-aminopeptidase